MRMSRYDPQTRWYLGKEQGTTKRTTVQLPHVVDDVIVAHTTAVNPAVDGFKPVPTGLCGCLLIMGASSVIFSEWAHLHRGKDKRNNRAVVVNVLQLQPNIH